MRPLRPLCITAFALTLAASGAAAQTDPNQNAGRSQGTPPDQKKGFLGIGGSDAEQIRSTLARFADEALSENPYDTVVRYLVDADRNRLQDADHTDEQRKTLREKAKAVREAWKARYGADFDARGHRSFLGNVQIQEGEIGRDAQLAAEVRKNSETAEQTSPVPPGDSGNVTGDRPPTPSNNTRTLQTGDRDLFGRPVDRSGNNASDQNLDKGRNIAVVSYPAMGGGEALRVPLIHELPDAWKINVPDRLTSRQFHDNLSKGLSEIAAMQSQWPADADTAYRLITHRVLAAALDAHREPQPNATTDQRDDVAKSMPPQRPAPATQPR